MYSIYQIQVGDTLDTIAQKVGTTKQLLLTINGITDTNLVPGNYIVIPMNVNLPFTTYTIKKGDNIYEIARNYNVDYETLLEINGLDDDDYVYPNQEIIIPNKNFNIYVTRENDSLATVAARLNATQTDLIRDNATIYLLPEQLILYRK